MNQETKETSNNLDGLQIPDWVQPNGGDDKKKKRKRSRAYIIRTAVSTGIIVGLVFILLGYIDRERAYYEDERELFVEQVTHYEELLNDQQSIIEEIQIDEWTVSDELYQAVKDVCKNSDDEVIQRLWKEKFPKKNTFTDDRASGIVKIYAMLDNHIEIRCDDRVLNAVQSIDVAKLELKNAVDIYNTYYEFYSFWVDEWNESYYTVRKEGKKKNEFQLKEINLTLNIMDDTLIEEAMSKEN